MKKREIGEWASIAEIIGTIAVVVSLALVIVSIRQNTAVMQVSNESFQYDLLDRWLSDLVYEPEIFENWDKLTSNETMTSSERGQVIAMIQRSLNMWEYAFVSYKAGFLSEEQWLRVHTGNLDWAKRRVPESIWRDMVPGHWDPELHEMIDAAYRND